MSHSIEHISAVECVPNFVEQLSAMSATAVAMAPELLVHSTYRPGNPYRPSIVFLEQPCMVSDRAFLLARHEGYLGQRLHIRVYQAGVLRSAADCQRVRAIIDPQCPSSIRQQIHVKGPSADELSEIFRFHQNNSQAIGAGNICEIPAFSADTEILSIRLVGLILRGTSSSFQEEYQRPVGWSISALAIAEKQDPPQVARRRQK